MQDHLVARIAGRPEGEVDRLGGADRDQDFAGRIVLDAVAPLQMIRESAAQFDSPVVGGVVGPSAAEAGDARLDDRLGSIEVGLPDAQADDVLHRGQDVEEAANARWRNRAHALGQCPVGQWAARRTGQDPWGRFGFQGRLVFSCRLQCGLDSGVNRHDAESTPARSAGVGVPGSSARARSAGSNPRQSAPAVMASYARDR